jgi:hypothetical protein
MKNQEDKWLWDKLERDVMKIKEANQVDSQLIYLPPNDMSTCDPKLIIETHLQNLEATYGKDAIMNVIKEWL